MQQALRDFEQRVKEIDAFFRILNRMEKPDAAFLTKTVQGRRKSPIDPDGFTMLKATAFLVIYNMIEAAIRSAFDVFYNTIHTERRTLEELCPELRDIWLMERYHGIDSHSARDTARSIVEDILNHSAIQLTGERLFSGNLDAKKIREIYEEHGVNTKTHHKARGGGQLRIVKDKRNALAHGSESFLECGREFTVRQLEGIKREAEIFVRSILRNMEKHIEGAQYAVKA